MMASVRFCARKDKGTGNSFSSSHERSPGHDRLKPRRDKTAVIVPGHHQLMISGGIAKVAVTVGDATANLPGCFPGCDKEMVRRRTARIGRRFPPDAQSALAELFTSNKAAASRNARTRRHQEEIEIKGSADRVAHAPACFAEALRRQVGTVMTWPFFLKVPVADRDGMHLLQRPTDAGSQPRTRGNLTGYFGLVSPARGLLLCTQGDETSHPDSSKRHQKLSLLLQLKIPLLSISRLGTLQRSLLRKQSSAWDLSHKTEIAGPAGDVTHRGKATADGSSDQEGKVQKGLAGFRESMFVFLVDEPLETFRIL
ncbi:unnamed protein product [Symbiodinium microadriaticum]|nr:unnamed protein product [Symbiodinium microadriaticum]